MDTNDPFGDKSVYRLDLSAIKSWRYPLDDSHVISGYGGRRHHSGADIKNKYETLKEIAFVKGQMKDKKLHITDIK